MGPSNVVEAPESVAPPEVYQTESQPVEQSVSSNGVHASTQSSAQREPSEGSSQGVPNRELGLSAWLYRSHVASVLWLGVRLWLGYEWFNAGYQKIWGSEKAAFWFGNGAGVKGFATAGVVGSASGKGGASYGWWAGFLHNFVVPNASWIGRLISVSELVIGVALVLGLLTGVAAFAGLSLNLIYMFSGSAGVNPMFAIAGLFLVLAWRNAGWFGLDRFVLRSTTWTRNRRIAGANATHRRVVSAAS
jgi:thiosulfate dehydrogenase (quinone) large subunit